MLTFTILFHSLVFHSPIQPYSLYLPSCRISTLGHGGTQCSLALSLPSLSFYLLRTFCGTVLSVICYFFSDSIFLDIMVPLSKALTPIMSCRSQNSSLASSRKPVSSRLILRREGHQFWTLFSADQPFLFLQ